MRTRTSTQPLTLSAGSRREIRRFQNPGPSGPLSPIMADTTVTTPSWTGVSLDVNSNVITDELHYKKTQGYCKHTCTTYILGGFSTPYRFVKLDPSVGGSFHEITLDGGWLGYTYMRTRMSSLRPTISISAMNWEEASFGALKAMLPKFSEMSLANDLIELKQIKELIRPLGLNLLTKRKPWDPPLTEMIRRRYFLGRVSNLYLWYKFGVMPILQTIAGVTILIRQLSDRVRDIVRRGDRLQTRHYARPLDIAGAIPGDSDIYVENTNDFRDTRLSRRIRWIDSPQYHATLKFKYDVNRIKDFSLELRAWVEAFGGLKPLNVLWNAIPFSFVIDWFVNIGEWVDAIQSTPTIPIVIEDFSHSVKYSYRTDIDISYYKGALTLPLGNSIVSEYERRRDIPSFTPKTRLTGISESQARLGAALIGQAAGNRAIPKAQRKPPSLRWLRFDSRSLLR